MDLGRTGGNVSGFRFASNIATRQATRPQIVASPDSNKNIRRFPLPFLENLRELGGESSLRFLRNLAKAVFWHGLGRVVQVVGLAYALRCLGPDNIGLSGTVIVAAAYGQLALDFGLDVVSVRHVAAGTVRLDDLVPAMFSTRLLVGFAAALVWFLLVVFLPMDATTRRVWLMGAFYLAVLTLSASWYYQATERMHRFSMIQNSSTIAVSLCFLLLFHPGQAAGSDLLVMLVMTALTTAGIWWHAQRSRNVALFRITGLRLAQSLLREGRPMWCFNLCYTALSSMGLPLCYALLSNRESGYYRAAGAIATSLQMFLIYFTLMLYPRIVAWRNTASAQFRSRILLVVCAVLATGLAAFGGLWALRMPIMRLLGGTDFMPAAPLLAILVTAKFIAIASGVVIWALLAAKRDWLAAKCCAPLVVGGLALNWWLIPLHGVGAAAWLNGALELALLLSCLATFLYVERRRPDIQ